MSSLTASTTIWARVMPSFPCSSLLFSPSLFIYSSSPPTYPILMPQRLFLLDAYALIYRAYYAFIKSPRIDTKGRNTSAVFGFVLMLEDLLGKENPDEIAVVFDPPGGTFRHREYPEYKAQREETPEGIRIAVPLIRELLRAYRIPAVEVPDYEADDVIGTLSVLAAEAGREVYMVTPDKDYGQLVTEQVRMYRPMQGGGYEVWGPEEIKEKFGLQSPLQVIDYLALLGDKVDNIPGCKGIGEKGAQKLLAEYGSIDSLLAHASEIKGATGKKIQEGAEAIRLSYYLATIRRDVPLDYTPGAFAREAKDEEAVRRLFEDLEFRTLLSRVLGPARPATPKPQPEPMGDLFAQLEEREEVEMPEVSALPKLSIEVLDRSSLPAFLARAEGAKTLALDTETTGIDPLTAGLVAITFALDAQKTYYLDVPADPEEARSLLQELHPLFAREGLLKVGQNLKYDLQVLRSYGVEVAGPFFDTMIAHYLLYPDMRHGLDELAEKFLGYRMMPFEEMIAPQTTKSFDLRLVEPERLQFYAAEDTHITYLLYEYFSARMEKARLTKLFEEIEMPLMLVLLGMEREGVRLDKACLARQAKELQESLALLEEEINTLIGHPININSSKQVGEVLFDELQIVDKPKKTKTGGYTTSEEVLEKLRDKHPVVGKILDYRGVKKLLSTYVESLPELVYPDGKIHTTFNQTIAATGRLSSSNPNIQNIPIRTPEGRAIREAFVPDEGCTFLSADYSQIELRLMAHFSQDPALIEAFRAGQDVHQATAAKIYGIPLEEVSPDMRRRAKTANFGIIYGISAFGLSERLSIPRKEAKELIDGYFASYPGVARYMTEVIETAKKQGYVTTLLDRRRLLPDINSANAVVRGYAERNAINAPLQGSAADLIKIAMIRLDEAIRQRGLRSRMILQVHDELNFNVPFSELEEMTELVRTTMESIYPSLLVPLEVSIGHGPTWLAAH